MKKERKEIEETTKCPECGGTNFERDRARAEIVCENCGFVLDWDLIDYGPEWRAFDKEQRDKRERVGPPTTPTQYDRDLSTVIGKGRDSYGKSLSAKTRYKMYRLRKWQERLAMQGSREANLSTALSEIARMSSVAVLSRDIRETASVIYRKATMKGLTRGRAIKETAAALYAACRQCGVPRTLDEIASVSGIPRKKIGRTYRLLSRELGLKLMPTSPIDYVSRFCSQLKLNGGVRSKAIEILEESAKKELSTGKGPTGTVAASVYIASILCGEKRTQREVADVAGVTEVTVRNRYKKLAEELSIDIAL